MVVSRWDRSRGYAGGPGDQHIRISAVRGNFTELHSDGTVLHSFAVKSAKRLRKKGGCHSHPLRLKIVPLQPPCPPSGND
jgi:hypothetical protein